MKKIFGVLTTLVLALPLWGRVNISLEPETIMAGEPARVVIHSDEGGELRIVQLPDVTGLKWSSASPSVSNNISIVNSQRVTYTTAAYEFTVAEPGQYVIPEMIVAAGDKKYRTREFPMDVKSRRYRVQRRNGTAQDENIDRLVFQRLELPSEPKHWYVGEEIPLTVKVYIADSIQARLRTWPEINLDKVIFRDYGNVGGQNRNFAPPRQDTEEQGDYRYATVSFSSAFRPLAAGTLNGTIATAVEVMIPDSDRDRDDSFGMMMMRSPYRTALRRLTSTIGPIEVLPLPKPPEDAVFTGLVGDWKLTFKLTPEKIKVGDTATLTVAIQGQGSLETLHLPPLELPGFRVYPPEIVKNADRGSAEARYVLVPTEPGPHEIKLHLAVFQCQQGQYRGFDFQQKVQVEKSDALTSSDEVFVGSLPDNAASVGDKSGLKRPKTSIIYLKKRPAGGVALPLSGNYVFWYWLLGLLGPVVMIVTEWRCRRRQRLDANPDRLRRADAASRRGQVVKKLKTVGDEELCAAINQDVVPFVNDMMALPPGISAMELVERLQQSNPEMAECLRHAGGAGYMPGALAIGPEELRRKVIAAVKRFAVVLLMLGTLLPLSAVSSPVATVSVPTAKEINSAATARTAYDRGQFAAAAAYYRRELAAHNPDPAWLFNLGNCLLQQKKYASALACYERAARLAPRDSDIEENLNFVRSRLNLPPKGGIRHPLELIRTLRDRLRPDQWLLVLAGCWTLWFLLM
ncbi:MAG: BatD family protein, partial [Victivallales bacterium]|nr:BatD family protein [Victivallales bacterium]